MYSAKIFKVTGLHFSYILRRVQSLFTSKAGVPEEVKAILQECKTVEELLDFFFTTDFYVDEAFISLFEKRMQELECPFWSTRNSSQQTKTINYGNHYQQPIQQWEYRKQCPHCGSKEQPAGKESLYRSQHHTG